MSFLKKIQEWILKSPKESGRKRILHFFSKQFSKSVHDFLDHGASKNRRIHSGFKNVDQMIIYNYIIIEMSDGAIIQFVFVYSSQWIIKNCFFLICVQYIATVKARKLSFLFLLKFSLYGFTSWVLLKWGLCCDCKFLD